MDLTVRDARSDDGAAIVAIVNPIIEAGQGFRVVGAAQRQAKLRGRYVDEAIVERLL